ncbi:MAG TPA: acyl-CoA dehydrogenase [Longimicrobiales bacterium]|nr:acyl-CoA dehydrogenase [Longimicrobiales bacterium]
MTEPTGRTLDPDVLPLAPLIYIAWADRHLSRGETAAIRRIVRDPRWRESPAARAVEAWLDPRNPPSAAELQELLEAVRAYAADLPPDRRRSLVRLGQAIAAATPDPQPFWTREEVVAAMTAVEEALGVVPEEAARALVDEAHGAAQEAGGPAERPRRSFDPAPLQRLLEADFPALRAEVKELLRQPSFQADPGQDAAAYRRQVMGWLRLLADRGYGALGFPPEYGGRGDIAAAIAVFETVALRDLSLTVKFGVHFGLFGGSVLLLGTERHHSRWLREIATLELPGCFAMTETGHGSNVREIRTTARYDARTGEFVLATPDDAARKDYIGNAAVHGRMATVFAQLEVGGESHGVHALLVPLRDPEGRALPGIRIEDCGHKAGLNGVDNGRIWFDSVRVPRDNLLDRFATVSGDGVYSSPIVSPGRRFFTMIGTLVAGRISIAAAANSAAKVGLATAVRYTDRRRQFGPAGEPEIPVLDYLHVQRRIIPRLATTYALHFALRSLVHRYAAKYGEHDREVEARAAGLKAYASRHALDTLQACREVCGGAGYLSENPFGRLRADTDVFTTFEGVNVVLYQLVAKALLTEFRDEMADLRLWDAVRWVAGQAATRVTELNPVATRRTDRDHLLDPGFHAAALEYREGRLLGSLARRLKRRIDTGMDSFDALNEVQDHVVVVARAHVERVVLERFRDGIGDVEEDELRGRLDRLAALFALHAIEEDRGWYLEAGYLEAPKAGAIRALVTDLCGDVRTDAVALVDAFGIPLELLGASAR